jgi:hypothetical protein
VQTSDVTANDFSSPLTYTVTPAVGTPVEYTVTAASSAQGLRGGSIQGVPLSLSGIVDTLAGQASIFGDPAGCVVVGSPSYIYVADYAYHVIWRIQNFNPYAAEVFAGALSEPGFNDGTGTSARFSNPQGMATDGTYLYVADFSNGAIRKIAIGTGDVVPFVSGLDGPTGIYYYALGNILYETDAGTGAVRSISMGGTVTTLLTNQPTGNEWPVDMVRYNDKL